MSAWKVRSSCDVPPLPSKHGVAWHGFDSKHREAAFRLDTSEDATAEHHGSRVMSGGGSAHSATTDNCQRRLHSACFTRSDEGYFDEDSRPAIFAKSFE